ncbi:hypothetical protein [Nocardioides sp. YIM 152315]|uniref:hypothetical protein n=1 Tax=Nocardioides sp. YIM 152315 TaxID=3031760 RepID=UPI0023DBE4F4|nr:hypothetical protein [Nocardioides sp. YIM 152315]MDF1605766.1 hypothetical protein [Nocardioides sp. YIM 152315]
MPEQPHDRRAARAERADAHREAQRRQRAQESAKAQVLLDRFVDEARRAGIATEELTARPWSGGRRYRTGISGWYLRNDGSVGVDADGRYYELVVAPVRFGRWRTVRVEPTAPPLQVGEGARDGESIALADLVEIRLRRS